ncbi:ROK family transcriptional regulator [Natronoglycomyces albus]|uniref:ROK family protein n=1 Tax=Natronoglycomyces albus TaxID=2811108 RepID=A0A895XMK1_9ACTN|nr:ROK family transcriptional regulator [Natronoglycomyces albus]QSB06584.1 ROK family protein [Natronoglycomyces albus]
MSTTSMRVSARRANFHDVRASNLGLIMRNVRLRGPSSRADLASVTGLNKATVSSLVTELIERRLLRESGSAFGNVGRPAVLLTVDTSYYAAIGIEVNVDYIALVAVDLDGNRLLSWRRSYTGFDVDPNRSIAAIAALTQRAMATMDVEGREVLALKVAVPGLVDAEGRVRHVRNLGWKGVDIAAALREVLGYPPYPIGVDNDANLGALAEHRFGSHAGTANLMYLTGEYDLGAGLIIGNYLHRGADGYAGEICHVPVTYEGEARQVGDVASIKSILQSLTGTNPSSVAEVEADLEEVLTRATQGDQETVHKLSAIGSSLGEALAAACDFLNPEVVILGGHYVPLAPWILPTAEKALQQRARALDATGVSVVVTSLDREVAALGAATGILNEIDAGSVPTPLGRAA